MVLILSSNHLQLSLRAQCFTITSTSATINLNEYCKWKSPYANKQKAQSVKNVKPFQARYSSGKSCAVEKGY